MDFDKYKITDTICNSNYLQNNMHNVLEILTSKMFVM